MKKHTYCSRMSFLELHFLDPRNALEKKQTILGLGRCNCPLSLTTLLSHGERRSECQEEILSAFEFDGSSLGGIMSSWKKAPCRACGPVKLVC